MHSDVMLETKLALQSFCCDLLSMPTKAIHERAEAGLCYTSCRQCEDEKRLKQNWWLGAD